MAGVCPLFLASLSPIHFPWTTLTSYPHLLEDNDTLSDLESHKLKMTQPPLTWGPDYHQGAEKCFSPPFILSLCWWIYFMWVRKKLISSMPLTYGDVLITAASSTGTNTIYHLAQLMSLCSWKHCLCSAFMTLHSSSFPSIFMISLSHFCWFFFIFLSKCWISPGSVLDPLLYFHLLPGDLIQSCGFKHSQIYISNPGFSQNSWLVYPITCLISSFRCLVASQI